MRGASASGRGDGPCGLFFSPAISSVDAASFGETPGTHQRRLRLDHAAWLLLTSRATVLDVALETGFENHETFTRAFRTRFGVTPSVFARTAGRHCRDRYGLRFPQHSTRIMPKKTGSITSATHRLTLEIAKPQAAVWKAFTDDINRGGQRFLRHRLTATHDL